MNNDYNYYLEDLFVGDLLTSEYPRLVVKLFRDTKVTKSYMEKILLEYRIKKVNDVLMNLLTR